MDVTKNQNQIVSETEIPEDDQYSLRKIVAIWALATAPMTFFAFVLTPAIISHFNIPDSVPAFLVFWPLMIVGLVWQFVLSLIIVYRETGELRWRTMKKRMCIPNPATRRLALADSRTRRRGASYRARGKSRFWSC